MLMFVLLEFPELFTEPPVPPWPTAVALPPVAFDEELELLLDCEDELLLEFDVLLLELLLVLGVVGGATGWHWNVCPPSATTAPFAEEVPAGTWIQFPLHCGHAKDAPAVHKTNTAAERNFFIRNLLLPITPARGSCLRDQVVFPARNATLSITSMCNGVE